jgi:hypothetical protein
MLVEWLEACQLGEGEVRTGSDIGSSNLSEHNFSSWMRVHEFGKVVYCMVNDTPQILGGIVFSHLGPRECFGTHCESYKKDRACGS